MNISIFKLNSKFRPVGHNYEGIVHAQPQLRAEDVRVYFATRWEAKRYAKEYKLRPWNF